MCGLCRSSSHNFLDLQLQLKHYQAAKDCKELTMFEIYPRQMPQETQNSIIFSPLQYQSLSQTTQILLNETYTEVLPPWLNSSGVPTCPREKTTNLQSDLSQAIISPNSRVSFCLQTSLFKKPGIQHDLLQKQLITFLLHEMVLNKTNKKTPTNKFSTHTKSSVFPRGRGNQGNFVFFSLKLPLWKIQGNC